MKQFKIWFKSIAVAFSMYSKIPMPRFVWKSEDMKYHLCFFPWIGALIGVLEVVWYQISCSWQTSFLSLCVMAAIPLLVTGGFHVDGFLDTCDALHSYQSMEKKREILKDPHIGAFAVLSLLTAVLLGLGFLSVISEPEAILAFAFSFFLSRCLSGLSVVLWKSAHDGMLQTSALTADKKCVAVVLAVQLLIGSVALFVLTGWYGLAALGCLFCSFLCLFSICGNRHIGIHSKDFLCCFFALFFFLSALLSTATQTQKYKQKNHHCFFHPNNLPFYLPLYSKQGRLHFGSLPGHPFKDYFFTFTFFTLDHLPTDFLPDSVFTART